MTARCSRSRCQFSGGKSSTSPRRWRTERVRSSLFRCRVCLWRGEFRAESHHVLCPVLIVCCNFRSRGHIGTSEKFRNFSNTFTQRFQKKAPFFSWCWGIWICDYIVITPHPNYPGDGDRPNSTYFRRIRIPMWIQNYQSKYIVKHLIIPKVSFNLWWILYALNKYVWCEVQS